MLIHSPLAPYFPKQARPHLTMATLRLLTLCAIVSTALAFVAMGPPSRHTAAATTRPTFTAWGSRGHTSSVKSLGAGTEHLRKMIELECMHMFVSFSIPPTYFLVIGMGYAAGGLGLMLEAAEVDACVITPSPPSVLPEYSLVDSNSCEKQDEDQGIENKHCHSALPKSYFFSPTFHLFFPPPPGRGLCMAMERTYIMAKPDAVQRGIISDIVGRFEKKGYKLVALKLVKPPRSLLEEHYESLKVRRKRKRERRRERGNQA